MKRIKWLFTFCVVGLVTAFVASDEPFTNTDNSDSEEGDPVCMPPVFTIHGSAWADSVLNSMTLEEKIGQLFMVPAYSNEEYDHQLSIEKLISEHHIGGLIFMQGDPISQAKLTNIYQAKSKVPLMIAMDAEWGLGMRLDNTTSFPRQMALGAMNDSSLVYAFGEEMARQCKRLGVHISFSPVVDVNNNPKNPVINNRAFGEDKKAVTKFGLAYMNGLQDNGVLACAKHFPGHGDTDTDSHMDLPVINHSLSRLKNIELYPFENMVHQGLGSMMVAHLFIPALDKTKNQPSTLSRPIITDLLRNDMFFDGLIFTDAMNMQGIAKYYQPGEMDVKALVAGNDVLLFPHDVPVAVSAIKRAIEEGVLTIEEIDESVLRILQVKDWSGAKDFEELEIDGIVEDLTNNKSENFRRQLIEKSLTVIRNKENVLPLTNLYGKKIATLSYGEGVKNAFNSRLEEFIDFKAFSLKKSTSVEGAKSTLNQLKEYDIVIVNLLGATNRISKNYGVSNQSLKVINEIGKNSEVVLNVFANPYSLNSAPELEVSAITIAYHDTKMTQEAVADMIMGSIGVSGKLPVSIGNSFAAGLGVEISESIRLQHVDPSFFNIESKYLKKVDSIVYAGIKEQAYPGCRVMAVKDGKIFFDKAYGHMTYEEKKKVNHSTVYDVASITKIAATVPSLMKLEGEDLFDVDATLETFYEVDDSTGYATLNMKEMLAHYAQLKPWIPFYYYTIEAGELKADLYKSKSEVGYSTKVAPDMFILDSYKDSIFDRILTNGFLDRKKYRYSDLGYYFFKEIVEKQSQMSLDNYVQENFYGPLGLRSMGYHPLEKNALKDVAPTEHDILYRRQVVKGYVHDPGAAMLGGVGGHAGVFSNAYDMAVLMQMFLNGGTYGGERYLNEYIVDKYTSCPYCAEDVRRGIGFDKPTMSLDRGSTCNSASKFSFGHTGFTGTIAWADPEHDIVFVFLSNRVYPNAENRKLLDMDIRTDIQQVFYDCFDIPSRPER